MFIFEIFFYYVNDFVITNHLNVVDLAGGFRVCTFGSFFGTATSLLLWRYSSATHQKRLQTDLLNQLIAFLSTFAIYILWPSFSGSLASGDMKHRIIINSILCMTSATVAGYALSSLLDPKNRFSVVKYDSSLCF